MPMAKTKTIKPMRSASKPKNNMKPGPMKKQPLLSKTKMVSTKSMKMVNVKKANNKIKSKAAKSKDLNSSSSSSSKKTSKSGSGSTQNTLSTLESIYTESNLKNRRYGIMCKKIHRKDDPQKFLAGCVHSGCRLQVAIIGAGCDRGIRAGKDKFSDLSPKNDNLSPKSFNNKSQTSIPINIEEPLRGIIEDGRNMYEYFWENGALIRLFDFRIGGHRSGRDLRNEVIEFLKDEVYRTNVVDIGQLGCPKGHKPLKSHNISKQQPLSKTPESTGRGLLETDQNKLLYYTGHGLQSIQKNNPRIANSNSNKTSSHCLVLDDDQYLTLEDVVTALSQNTWAYVGCLTIVLDSCFAGKWAWEFRTRPELRQKLEIYCKQHKYNNGNTKEHKSNSNGKFGKSNHTHQKPFHINFRLACTRKERANDGDAETDNDRGGMFTINLLKNWRREYHGETDAEIKGSYHKKKMNEKMNLKVNNDKNSSSSSSKSKNNHPHHARSGTTFHHEVSHNLLNRSLHKLNLPKSELIVPKSGYGNRRFRNHEPDAEDLVISDDENEQHDIAVNYTYYPIDNKWIRHAPKERMEYY